MSYQVLARKWRPRSFETLVGQEHVVRALTHALEQQRLHHAYLFTGTRGVGKTTIARIMAKALNCEQGISARPCGQCGSCIEIDGGRFVDYIELDAASNRGVEDMTQLLERATYAPTRGRYKVYVIDEVHQLSGHAFNAMLKTLEEPPEHVKFILATTDPQKIPVTVLSRCLQFNLKQMPQTHIVDHLAKVLDAEGVPYDLAALRPLAKGAAGSMRDALSLLDQSIAHGAGEVREAGVLAMLGAVGADHLLALLDALLAQDAGALVAVADTIEARNLSFSAALQDLAVLLHRIALMQFAPQAVLDTAERDLLARYAAAFDAEQLQLGYQIAIHGRDELALAPDEYSGFVMTLLRLLAFQPGAAPSREGGSGSRGAGSGGVGGPRPVTPAPTFQASTAAVRESRAAPSGTLAVAQISHPNAEPAGRGNDDWQALVSGLPAGAAKQLALHCELEARSEYEVRLRLSPAHKFLRGKVQEDRLLGELRRRWGEALRLQIDVAEAQVDTPASRAKAEAAERHDRAVEAIANDPLIQDLVLRFDASVDEASIRSI